MRFGADPHVVGRVIRLNRSLHRRRGVAAVVFRPDVGRTMSCGYRFCPTGRNSPRSASYGIGRMADVRASEAGLHVVRPRRAPTRHCRRFSARRRSGDFAMPDFITCASCPRPWATPESAPVSGTAVRAARARWGRLPDCVRERGQPAAARGMARAQACDSGLDWRGARAFGPADACREHPAFVDGRRPGSRDCAWGRRRLLSFLPHGHIRLLLDLAPMAGSCCSRSVPVVVVVDLFGLVPALHSTRGDLAATIKSDAQQRLADGAPRDSVRCS